MHISIPRETGRQERRVGLTPRAAAALVGRGHTVIFERGAGEAARFPDQEYEASGAQIAYSRDEALGRADVVCSVGLIPPADLALLRPGAVLLGFQHLAVAPPRALEQLRERQITAIAYELVQDETGHRPILSAFSQVAGELAVLVAGQYLQTQNGGRGILLGSMPGIAPAKVLVLGAGGVGRTAAARAMSLGAQVFVLDDDEAKLRELTRRLGPQVTAEQATRARLQRYTAVADVVIGAVLIPGARAPFLVTTDMVKGMRPGSVILDLSIDQGGCVETSRPTDLHDPVFVLHNVVHYCVPNMTSAIARTASIALADAVAGYVALIADHGPAVALKDPGLASGACYYGGRVVNAALAESLGQKAAELQALLQEAGR